MGITGSAQINVPIPIQLVFYNCFPLSLYIIFPVKYSDAWFHWESVVIGLGVVRIRERNCRRKDKEARKKDRKEGIFNWGNITRLNFRRKDYLPISFCLWIWVLPPWLALQLRCPINCLLRSWIHNTNLTSFMTHCNTASTCLLYSVSAVFSDFWQHKQAGQSVCKASFHFMQCSMSNWLTVAVISTSLSPWWLVAVLNGYFVLGCRAFCFFRSNFPTCLTILHIERHV